MDNGLTGSGYGSLVYTGGTGAVLASMTKTPLGTWEDTQNLFMAQ